MFMFCSDLYFGYLCVMGLDENVRIHFGKWIILLIKITDKNNVIYSLPDIVNGGFS